MQGLKKLRKKHNMTMQALADAIGVSKTSVVYWHTGRVTPHFTSLMALEELFDCKIKDLI